MAEMPSRAAFADWKRWTVERGEGAGTEKKFSESMQRYAAKKKTKTTAVFLGFRLRLPETGAWS